MVIPWVGFPLADLIKRVEPTSKAKFVEFVTLDDSRRCRGQQLPVLHWPYVEGLRMDEAMHPLTILAVGLYGEVLPNQNGAPIRLVVPWKYGFKGVQVDREDPVRREAAAQHLADARVAARNTASTPTSTRTVDHPRWSQATERRLRRVPELRPTLMFNGYGDQVASLYAGMDLKKNY